MTDALAVATLADGAINPPVVAWRLRLLAEAAEPVPRAVRSYQYQVKAAAVAAVCTQFASRHVEARDTDGERHILIALDTGMLAISWYDGLPGPLPLRPPRAASKLAVVSMQCLLRTGLPEGEVAQALETIRPYLVRPPQRRRVRTREIGLIQATEHGFEIASHGLPNFGPLVRTNYAPSVLHDYDRLRRFVQGKLTPDEGNLVLIDGPPGTGKTHLIRGLIRSIPAPYVLSTGSTIGNLDNPGFLPFIFAECRERDGLVLILEDADSVIVKRDLVQNTGLLSTLLNATSGILGDLTKLRVIATVNTWDDDRVDPAVLREGRLYARLHVDTLDVEQARAVVLRASGGNEIAAARVQGEMTLAAAYAIARAARGEE